MAVHQADIGIFLDLAREQRRKYPVVEHVPPGLIDQIVRDIEFGLDDHPEQAVATDHQIEQFPVFGR